MSEQNKKLIRRTVEEAWNRGKFVFPGEFIAKQQSLIAGA
jgi:hypothetical protein